MPGELRDDLVWIRDQSEANRIYNKGGFGRPQSGGSLSLHFVEAAYLLETGRLRLEDGPVPWTYQRFFTEAAGRQHDFEILYLVYRELRERGASVAIAAPALREKGIHFRLAPKTALPDSAPVYCRALNERSPVTATDLLSMAEVCSRDQADGLVAIVDEESEVTLYDLALENPEGSIPSATKSAGEAILVLDRVVLWDAELGRSLHEGEFFGKPLAGSLHLSLVEALYLVRERDLSVVDAGTRKPLTGAQLLKRARQLEPGIELRLRVFEDLKRRKLVAKTGYKFGAHFRVYETNPEAAHAPYLVHAVEPDQALDWPSLSRAVRLAHGVRKTLLLATPLKAGIRFLRLRRTKSK